MLSSYLLHTIGEFVLRVSPDCEHVEYAGPKELLSVSPDTFAGRSLSQLLPHPVAEAAEQCVRDVAATGGVKNFECSLLSETGTQRHFGGMVTRVDDGHLLLILRDIQATKEAELKAQESEARFRIMADQAPAMLWMAGIDGECEFFNKTWLEFTGRTLEQEVGVGWAEGVYFEDLQGCMKTYLDSFVARVSFKMEYRLRNARGEFRWLLDHGVPRYTPDGTFAGFIGSCVDITDAKLAAEITRQHTQQLTASLAEREGLLHKLEKRSTELARSNTELEQFVYAASHDLRAPLRAIHMLSEWISKDLGGGA
ncbi:MAG TPA: PAS domain S-box protein, partial [Polyangiaceae bacterium]|nr:PAS domain S-box protein [Polyangiaceae bacterium]